MEIRGYSESIEDNIMTVLSIEQAFHVVGTHSPCIILQYYEWRTFYMSGRSFWSKRNCFWRLQPTFIASHWLATQIRSRDWCMCSLSVVLAIGLTWRRFVVALVLVSREAVDWRALITWLHIHYHIVTWRRSAWWVVDCRSAPRSLVNDSHVTSTLFWYVF